VPQVTIATPQANQPAGSGGTFHVFGNYSPASARVSGIWVIRTDTGVQVGTITPITPVPNPYDFAYQVTGAPTNVQLALTVVVIDGGSTAQTTVGPFTCPP
jgi:hypothetical protein